jgi:hypothetical protein
MKVRMDIGSAGICSCQPITARLLATFPIENEAPLVGGVALALIFHRYSSHLIVLSPSDITDSAAPLSRQNTTRTICVGLSQFIRARFWTNRGIDWTTYNFLTTAFNANSLSADKTLDAFKWALGCGTTTLCTTGFTLDRTARTVTFSGQGLQLLLNSVVFGSPPKSMTLASGTLRY